MDAVQAATVIGAICGAITGVAAVTIVVGRPLRRIAGEWGNVREDLYGEAARPGVAPRPGALERLATAEQSIRQAQVVVDHHLVGHGGTPVLSPPS